MLKVGITGGIGSGKSTVCRLFRLQGVPVFNSDEAARDLLSSDPDVRSRIVELFGEAAYVNGLPDRPYISSRLFFDPARVAAMNAIMHPAAIRASEAWMQRQSAPYVLKESALLFESGSDAKLDFIIGVSAPEALRIARTMQRQHISREEVLHRMARQLDETEKLRRCDALIYNDDLRALIPQVLELHGDIMRQCGNAAMRQ